MITRAESLALLNEYIDNESLLNHSLMVAKATEAYAIKLGKDQSTIDMWWAAGLLHDLDWEKYPDEHPKKALNEILPPYNFPNELLQAIEAHAPERTGKNPTAELDCYLFACDELSGFIHAVSLMRPEGYKGMSVKSVTKKLKTLKFAESVPREDIRKGAELIETDLNTHIQFLINIFSN